MPRSADGLRKKKGRRTVLEERSKNEIFGEKRPMFVGRSCPSDSWTGEKRKGNERERKRTNIVLRRILRILKKAPLASKDSSY